MKSVTIYDPEPVQLRDLGSQVCPQITNLFIDYRGTEPDRFCQYFLHAEDVGKPRAEVTQPRLAELNTYVPVRILPGNAGEPITTQQIKGFQVSLTNKLWKVQSLLIDHIGCCLE